jgi:hypothetical protein
MRPNAVDAMDVIGLVFVSGRVLCGKLPPARARLIKGETAKVLLFPH